LRGNKGQNCAVLNQRAGRVLAVVSLFRPSAATVDNASRIARQVDALVAVDDGSGDAANPVLSELESRGITVVRLEKNEGIAAALNHGIGLLDPVADDVVVTFDQDSQVPEGFLSALIDVLDRSKHSSLNVAIVTPASFGGIDQTGGAVSGGFTEASRPIQSGMLITGRALEFLGHFDAELFIDLVDVEYFLRAKAAGMQALAVPGLDLPHNLGEFRTLRLGGIALTTTLSTPFRYYYRARNRMVLNRRYRRTAFPFLARESVLDLAHFGIMLLFARPAWRMVRVLLKGRRDARGGKLGRIPADIAELASSVTWRGVTRK
jgi:rhamnosyltransferase